MLVGSLVAARRWLALLFGSTQTSKLPNFSSPPLLVGIYVVSALGLSTIYQATAKIAVWKLTAQSLRHSVAACSNASRPAGEASSPLGEGLADALNVGGL